MAACGSAPPTRKNVATIRWNWRENVVGYEVAFPYFGERHAQAIAAAGNKRNNRAWYPMRRSSSDSSVIFADGYVAGIAGEPQTTNPHENESGAASVWMQGWDEGNARSTWNRTKPKSAELPSQ
jgi:ribosome modulation factor